MRIAIVEDDKRDRSCLESYIKKYLCKKEFPINVVTYSVGENFLEDEELTELDVVFLDIYMGKENGMEIAKNLRKRDYNSVIVFCTTTSSFALEGYMVKAYDYIVKPYTYENIESVMEDISELLNEKIPCIHIKDGRQWFKLKISDIFYVENHANYVYIHTKKEMHTTRMTFTEMETLLSPYSCFVRCDRGVIVNMNNIYKLHHNTILMGDGEQLPISRRNIAQVNEQYLHFIFDEMEKK
ncbi:MAG: LytTR family DNA-binding domain-containing protein [Lachnospiraceae bacterium]